MMLTAKDGKCSVRCSDVSRLGVGKYNERWQVMAFPLKEGVLATNYGWHLADCATEAEAVEALRGYASVMEKALCPPVTSQTN